METRDGSRLRAALVAMAVAVGALMLAPSGASAAFGFLTQWGTSGDAEGEFDTLNDVVVGPEGNVYVTEGDSSRVQVFSSAGTFLRTWGWGVDDGIAALQVCTSGCQGGASGAGDGQFNVPSGIATDSLGNVYVVDRDNSRVQKFSATGAFITKWGVNGQDPGEFNNPQGIATDPTDNVYVVDGGNGRVQKFNSAGVFERTWGWGVQDGSDAFQNCISGCQAGVSNADTTGASLEAAEDIAVNSAGSVYVTSPSNDQVSRFETLGSFLGAFGSAGSGPGELDGPLGVHTDSAGSVYVGEAGNDRVQKFSSTGSFLGQFGAQGSGPGQFLSPAGLATDSAGNVYVGDRGNDRIQKFGESTTTPPPATNPPPSTKKKCKKGKKLKKVKGKKKCVKKRKKKR